MSELEQVLNEYHSLGINQQLDYDKFYLYSIITHSTAIEGSTVTEVEAQLLFDEGITSSKRTLAEQMMNLDLKKAYEQSFEYAKNHEKITIELLCKLSGIAMANTGASYNTISGTFSSAKGELRLVNVSAGRGGKSYLAWQKVPEKLQKVCDYLNEQRSKINKDDIEAVYRLSFEAHYMLVSIHPWADGNGRMSRLLMNMIQKEFGLVPSIVKKESRTLYIQSLSESQEKEDSSDFVNFMFNHHLDNIKEQLLQYKKSMQDDTLKIKNDTLNDTLNLTEKEKAVLKMIQANLNITANQIVQDSGFSRPTVMRAIKTLKEKNLLERLDSKKTGSWKVNL